MKKEWMLLAVTTVVTMLLAVSLLRWLYPQLLGVPSDLQLVRVDKEVSPFFDGIFRQEDRQNNGSVISDPFIKRAKPFYPDEGTFGPHDLLGFRNRNIPVAADIITIGDSQTYGNNALLEQNWPSFLKGKLSDENQTLYNMSTGGWGAVEYLDIFSKAIFFSPKVVIVAFYTGNDPIESFRQAYGADYHSELRPDKNLKATDQPTIIFPVPKSEWRPITFKGGRTMIFTPKYRHGSNQDHPAVKAGYQVMADVAGRIAKDAKAAGIVVVFTIIPTKELVYAPRIEHEKLAMTSDYAAQVRDETKNIEWLGERLAKIEGANYVNVVSPLQNAAMKAVSLYPLNADGHPSQDGYFVIADAISPLVNKLLPPFPSTPFLLDYGNEYTELALVRDRQLSIFASESLYRQNGWETPPAELPRKSLRDTVNFPKAGVIVEAAPDLFGPR